jgi:hypothetical protein
MLIRLLFTQAKMAKDADTMYQLLFSGQAPSWHVQCQRE